MIAFPLPAAAAELPAGVQQILQQSELTPDKLVHITLQELLQTLAGWLKNAWGQPLQLARRAVLFLLLSSCVGLLADGGAHFRHRGLGFQVLVVKRLHEIHFKTSS